MMRHKHSHRRGLSKWLIMLTCAGRPGGHVSRVSPLLIVIDKYCCYQNLRRRQQINLLPAGMSKYTGIISQEPSVKYRYGYHNWLTHMVCLYKQICLKPQASHVNTLPRIRMCSCRRCSGCPHSAGWGPAWCSGWRGRAGSCCWSRTESFGPRRGSRQLPPVQTRSTMRRSQVFGTKY